MASESFVPFKMVTLSKSLFILKTNTIFVKSVLFKARYQELYVKSAGVNISQVRVYI